MTVSQHAQYQDIDAEAAKWNSAIIHFIIYTCAFPTVTCQNVFCDKGPWYDPDVNGFSYIKSSSYCLKKYSLAMLSEISK